MTAQVNCRAPTADHPLDAYWTPREATRAFLRLESPILVVGLAPS
jgi:hypothetical protein